ncbi:hypothetical protein ACFOTA_21775 [Chitinophaga sp. GCM10012297]|uniref:Uncharacterized protein n=1 Tax=Chitinophaga chungangae TaxID=2821488 RepID=A0ABS3YJJ7_9BACT|nr:hypothetical protein [Chitinophaga chungangae]MBO9154859.1 hypothetical protein [Chitinophaga chungangae]
MQEPFMYTGEELDMCLRQIAGAGCQPSYRRLFHWFCKPLKQFALMIVRSSKQAEEIAADLPVNIWKNRHPLFFIDNIRVYRITRNSCKHRAGKTEPSIRYHNDPF